MKRISDFYKSEFSELFSTLSKDDATSPPFSRIRDRLGSLVRSTVRYGLRYRLNCIPPHFTTFISTKFDHVMPDYSNCRSKVHELVCLSEQEGVSGFDELIADGSVAAVVNIALQRIYDFASMLGFEPKSDQDDYFLNDVDIISSVKHSLYHLSASSMKGFARNSNILEHDVCYSDVINDVNTHICIIAAANSYEFLLDLFEWPGVNDAIEGNFYPIKESFQSETLTNLHIFRCIASGGWKDMEDVTSKILSLRIFAKFDTFSHFMLLRDIKSFMKLLRSQIQDLKLISKDCEKNLRDIWKRFRCGTFL